MSLNTNEKFCLRWNDFESNISVAFREIREEKDFFDCTLSCGSRQIQAHKLILSACSPFFKTVLKQNPHQHPLLYLKGINLTNLQAVMDFMYNGEVNVAQEELNSFLAAAEELQVKGLTQNGSGQNKKTTCPKPPEPPLHQEVLKPKERNKEPYRQAQKASTPEIKQSVYQEPQYDQDVEEVVPMVKTEPEQASYISSQKAGNITEVANIDSYEEEGFVYEGYEGVEEQGYDGHYEDAFVGDEQSKDLCNDMILESGGQFECSECGRSFTMKSQCRRHVQNVHSNHQKILCPVCHKYMKNPTTLKSHLRGSHGVYQK